MGIFLGLLGHDDPVDEQEAKRLPGWKGKEAEIYHIDGQVAHKVSNKMDKTTNNRINFFLPFSSFMNHLF